MNVTTLRPLRYVFPAILMVALCPLFAGSAAAQARVTLGAKAGACEQRVVDDAMEVSSLRTFAAQVPDDMKSLVSAMEAGRRIQPAARQMVLQALQQAFDSSALDEEFHRGMRNHCDAKIFPVAIAQMRTPLGMKMRKLEDSLLTPQGRSAFIAYSRSAASRQSSPQREAVLDRLENVVRMADFMADVNAEEARATYIGISGKSASDAETQALRDKILPSMQRAMRISSSFTYRSASDEELEQYVAMLDGAEMRRFYTIIKSVMEEGMIRRSQVAAAIIQQSIANTKGARTQ